MTAVCGGTPGLTSIYRYTLQVPIYKCRLWRIAEKQGQKLSQQSDTSELKGGKSFELIFQPTQDLGFSLLHNHFLQGQLTLCFGKCHVWKQSKLEKSASEKEIHGPLAITIVTTNGDREKKHKKQY